MTDKKLPSIAERLESRTLPNGLRIFVYPNRRAPVFTAQAWVATGSMHEEQFLGCGLSHFLEHMVFTGTKNYPGNSEIADKASSLGAVLNAWTSYANTTYYMEAPKTALKDVLDMISDMISLPLFPEKTFLREKDVILRECAMRDDNPGNVLVENLFEELFRVSPLRVPIIGYENGIRSVDRDMMVDYYQRRYSPHRSFFVVSGDVEPEEVFRFLEDKLGSWERRGFHEPFIPAEPPVNGARYAEHFFADPLARGVCGFRIPDISSEDTPALDVLASILGGTESSRMVTELRIKQELVTDTGVFSYSNPYAGIFVLNAEMDPAQTEKAMSAMMKVIRDVRSDGVTSEEICRIVRAVRTSKWNIFRSNTGIAQTIGRAMLNFGSVAFTDDYLEKVRNLTPEDIRTAAQKYLSPDTCVQSLLLPESMKNRKTKTYPPQKENKGSRHILKDKQRLIVIPDPESHYVSVNVVLHGGAGFENEETAGYSALLANTIFCGCGRYSEEEFNLALDDKAIQLDMNPAKNALHIQMESDAGDFPEAMELLTELLAEPLFPEKAFEREKNDLILEWESAMQDPRTAAFEYAKELHYGKDSPYGKTLAAKVKAIKKATPASIRKFLRDVVLNAPGCCISVSGACTVKSAQEQIRKMTGRLEWKKQKNSFPCAKMKTSGPAGKAYVIPRGQAIPVYTLPLPSVDDRASVVPVLLLKTSLQGMSSPLFKEIREAEGLAYYASCSGLPGFGESMLYFFAGTRPDTAERVFLKFEEVRKNLAENGLNEEEFETAKKRALYDTARKFQDAAGTAAACVVNEYWNLGWEASFRILDELRNADRESVNRVICDICSCKKGKWILVSPEKFAKKSPFL